MEDFGSYLKSERELRGVPLEEVSTNTKIHVRFLQALENNQFDDLPGEVFVKGYIRSFAKVIGSDEEEMLSAYDDAMKQLLQKEISTSVPVKEKASIDKNFILGLGLTILFLAGVGWGINILIQKLIRSAEHSESMMLELDQKKIKKLPKKNLSDSAKGIKNELLSPKKEDESPGTLKKVEPRSQIKKLSNNLSGKPIQSVDNLSATETKENTMLTSKTNLNTMANISNNENDHITSTLVTETDMPLKLTISVKDNTWFNLTVDESLKEDFILPKGAAKTFYGKDNFRITLGNRHAVDLRLNDKILSLPDGDENNLLREFIINSQLIG
jgi:cytoskeletal protein RodZ